MPTNITITTELTRQGLLTVRDEIDALLATSDTSAPATSAPVSTGEPAEAGNLDALAIELKSHLSPNLKRLVGFLVENYVGTEFTWDNVATAMNEDAGSVKSWHRSLSKPLNRIRQANPSAPWFLTGTWDGLRNHYKLSAAWAEAVDRTW